MPTVKQRINLTCEEEIVQVIDADIKSRFMVAPGEDAKGMRSARIMQILYEKYAADLTELRRLQGVFKDSSLQKGRSEISMTFGPRPAAQSKDGADERSRGEGSA